MVHKPLRKHWRGRGIGITNLSWQQEQIAKNVTIQMTIIARVGCSFPPFSVSVKRSSV
jgi:hypothetical protein